MNTNKIENINIAKLHPHPQNPRRDLGDLTELADSIRENGIMQNLTVVKYCDYRCNTCKNFNSAIGACKLDYENELSSLIHAPSNADVFVECPKYDRKQVYTVIIGHRRLAAAKLAGLELLPCAVVEMSDREQISVMLTENMQRADLTIAEQAHGIQLMLDLGDAVEDVAKRTGFSESTIRRRAKLAVFDAEKLRASVERGATLGDYEKIQAFDDPEVQAKLLDVVGTKDFEWDLKREKDAQKKAANLTELEVYFATIGAMRAPLDISKTTVRVKSFDENKLGKFVMPEEHTGGVKYYYTLDSYWAQLYRSYRKGEKMQNSKARSTKEAVRKRANELKERAFSCRSDFVKGFTVTKDNRDAVLRFAARYAFKRSGYDYSWVLCRTAASYGKELKPNPTGDDLLELDDNPARLLLRLMYNVIDAARSTLDYELKYQQDKVTEEMYAALEELGYEMSDEERQFLDGTHEIFAEAEKVRGE
jgi:ParB family chromosome partitioning protein